MTILKKGTVVFQAILILFVCSVFIVTVHAESAEMGMEREALNYENVFPSWDPDSPALGKLIDFVSACTDESSPDYIPEADRIATFDMDGTLMGELFPTYLEVILLTDRILADPAYEPNEEMLEFGRMTRDHALDKSFPDDYDYQFSYHQARAFAGMTLDEYADFITRVLLYEADGFEGMTYGEAYYRPMAEVVEYLQDNGFKCYVVSGSDRFIVRTFIEGVFDIPSECIIGSDTALGAKNQGDTDGIEYVFTGDDTLVRTDRLIIKDLKTNKVLQIAQEIGHQPVLSFGNSSGDVSMNNYAICNNKYRSTAFMVVADDDVRDYGNSAKHDELFEKWQGMGYNAISMRDDWKTIYGWDVKKKGEFHWLNDYADDRIPRTQYQRPEDDPETMLPSYKYELKNSVEVKGRQGVCSEGDYYWVSGSTTLAKYDKDWNLISINEDPFKGYTLEVNHIADIDVYQNELYIGAEYFMDGVGKNIQIAVYDADSLELKRTFQFEVESGQLECSGIAVDPDTKTVWMCSWVGEESGRYLYKYDLETGEYLGKVHMQMPPQWLQGIAYYDGWFYMTADDGTADDGEPDHLYRTKIEDGATSCIVTLERTFNDVTLQGEIEGLTFDRDRNQLLLLYNRGARIILGMPRGYYDGYDREISEVFTYQMHPADSVS